MSRWCTLTLLLVIWSAAPQRAQAQMDPWPGQPHAYIPTPPPPGYVYPDGTNGVVPAGWRGQPYGGAEHYKQKVKSKGYSGPMGPLPSGPGRTIYEELPDDQGWLYDDSPLERFLKNTFRHAYFRVDYLLWDVEDPGKSTLGASSRQTFNGDPVNNFPVFQLPDPNSGTQLNVAQPTLTSVMINKNNGIRGTWGLPIFDSGVLESSVFALQTSISDINPSNIRDWSPGLVDTNGDNIPDTFVSQPLLNAVVQGVKINGSVPPGNNFLLVNGIDTNGDGITDTPAYSATLKTSVWGAESNYIIAPYNPNQNLIVSPLFGFRYMNFSEELRQRGQYDDPVLEDDGVTPVDPAQTQRVTRRIDSTTINNLYGPQIGMRAELHSKRLVIGVTPKVMLGLNSYRAQLDTASILRLNDPAQSLNKRETTFGIIGDVEVSTRLNLTDNFSASVGYNFLWAGMITRPADNIDYNIRSSAGGIPAQSAFGLDIGYSGAIMHGLNIGAQLEY